MENERQRQEKQEDKKKIVELIPEHQPVIHNRIKLLELEGDTPPSVEKNRVYELFPHAPYIIATDFEITIPDTETFIAYGMEGREQFAIEQRNTEKFTNNPQYEENPPKLIGFFYTDPRGSIQRIDHHANNPLTWMHRSSTNQAIDYVMQIRKAGLDEYAQSHKITVKEAYMKLRENVPVVVTHTDADSILASAILAGYLEPDEKFAKAAIAADHTGEENDIADLLQALTTKRDIDMSLRNLDNLLNKRPLEKEAQDALDQRKKMRQETLELKDKFVELEEGVMYYKTDEKKEIQGEFLPALFPDKQVIITASVLEPKTNKKDAIYVMKVRAGAAFPPGRSLRELELPGTGGRWNALSNKRKGGTQKPDQYVEYAIERMREVLPGSRPDTLALIRCAETEYTELRKSNAYSELKYAVDHNTPDKDQKAQIIRTRLEGILQIAGVSDVSLLPLSQTGKETAKKMAEQLAQILNGKPDLILCSPLPRAREQLAIMLQHPIIHDVPENDILFLSELEEQEAGPAAKNYLGDKLLREIENPSETIERQRLGLLHALPGAKNLLDLSGINKHLLNRLLNNEYNGKKIVIISHANTLISLRGVIEKWNLMKLAGINKNQKPEPGSVQIYSGTNTIPRLTPIEQEK